MSTCPFLAEVGADVLPFVSDVGRQRARGWAQHSCITSAPAAVLSCSSTQPGLWIRPPFPHKE